ncbi:hypothetical protein D9M73_249490 [compost metagenome]
MGFRQGFVELGVDVTLFRVWHDDVEVLLQALNHFWRDAAEGEDSLFHGYRARRAEEDAGKATSFKQQAAS